MSDTLSRSSPPASADSIRVMQEELDGVADKLDDLVEQVADLGISALREALEDPDNDGTRPEIEKRISRARRSAEKASVILRGSLTSGII